MEKEVVATGTWSEQERRRILPTFGRRSPVPFASSQLCGAGLHLAGSAGPDEALDDLTISEEVAAPDAFYFSPLKRTGEADIGVLARCAQRLGPADKRVSLISLQ